MPLSERQRRYRERHPDRRRASYAKWASKPEVRLRRRQYAREWYAKNRKRRAALVRERYHANPELRRAEILRAKYNLSLADYEAMVLEQGGLCAICGQPRKNRRLAVDHDHLTGAVRALLCIRCNTLIGAAEERIDLLLAVTAYLRRHKGLSIVAS